MAELLWYRGRLRGLPAWLAERMWADTDVVERFVVHSIRGNRIPCKRGIARTMRHCGSAARGIMLVLDLFVPEVKHNPRRTLDSKSEICGQIPAVRKCFQPEQPQSLKMLESSIRE